MYSSIIFNFFIRFVTIPFISSIHLLQYAFTNQADLQGFFFSDILRLLISSGFAAEFQVLFARYFANC